MAGFVFLRFICPSLISPEKASIIEGEIDPESQRHLILIAKIIQSIANNLEFGQKEAFMIPLNHLVIDYIPKVQHYLNELANGRSSQSVEENHFTPLEVLYEIDNFVEIVLKNTQIIDQKFVGQNQNDWLSVRGHLESYRNVLQIVSKSNEIPKRNKFSLFH